MVQVNSFSVGRDKRAQPVIFLSDTRFLREDRWEAVRIFGDKTESSVSVEEKLLLLLALFSVMLVSCGIRSGTGKTVDTLPKKQDSYLLFFAFNTVKM